MKNRFWIPVVALLLPTFALAKGHKTHHPAQPSPTPSPSASASPSPSPTDNPEPEESPTPKPDPERFKKADQAFKERRSETRGREALKLYREFYKQSPQDPEAAWRVGMGCYFVGIRLTQDKDEQQKFYTEGRDAGLVGAAIDPNCAPCHFWAAINMALYGENVGVFKMLFSLNDIQDHLKASLAIDPKLAYGGAYRLLGLIKEKLPGLLGGDDDKAKEYFEKAIETAPDEPLNFLFLARLLEERLDDHNGALAIAQKGLKIPTPTPDRLEAIDALKDLQIFVKEHPKPEEKKDVKK